MQREEKQLESLIEASVNRLNDLKSSIMAMVHKIETEHETIHWPTFLDNFALISSHLTGMSKILQNELGPPLRNLTVLPLLLTQDRDDALWQITEGRIPVFAHDLVPDYLRTKPDPAAEQKLMQHEAKAASCVAPDKQVAQYTKVVSHVYEMIVKAREEWEVESTSRAGVQQTSSLTDTHALVAAVGMGKNLKGGVMGPGGGMVPPSIRPNVAMGSGSPVPGGPMAKAPSAIKTNIKSANQIHPYAR